MNTLTVKERPGNATRLRDAVLELAGPTAALISHSDKAWASITFAGSRHLLRLRFSGWRAIAAGERFLEALPEHDFKLRGALVADAAITHVTQHVAIDPPFLDVTAELLVLDGD